MRTKLQIKAVEARNKNGKSFYRINTDQGWMSCWSEATAKEIEKYINSGAVILDVEANGAFKNVMSMITPSSGGQEEIDPEFPVEKPGVVPKTPFKDDRQLSIVRQCSIKAGTRLVCAMLATNKIDPKLNMPLATMITKTAEEFEEWINR